MTLEFFYLVMGVIVGILIRYEMDIRKAKKVTSKRSDALAVKEHSELEKYDDLLDSIRCINDNLKTLQRKQVKKKKKEV